MELIALLFSVGLVALAVGANKRIARNKFRRSVETYKRARLGRISEGADASSIPTVEEFLAERGELHLLAEIDRDFQFQAQDDEATAEALKLGLVMRTEMSDEFALSDDDGYETFVDEMWTHEGISLEGFTLRRLTHVGPIECELHSLVEGTQERLYLNLYEGGLRKTYAADSRHKWLRSGRTIDYSAFIGIMNGADPKIALGDDSYPQTAEQAASTKFDRVKTSDKKYVIGYRSNKGMSYRTVSRVIRYEDRFSARCHFRWGERRTFRREGLISVLDMQTGSDIDVAAFLSKRK